MDHYNVIIIGAGPAGASCANELVKNGVKTLIVEKKKLPRNKCCSGLLDKESVQFIYENFDNIPENLIYNRNVQMKFTVSGRKFRDIPGYTLLNIDRALFDHWLIKHSKVELLEEFLFYNFQRKKEKIIVFLKNNNKIKKITCNYLIGADGGNSNLRRLIDDNFKSKYLSSAIQKIYKGDFNIDKNAFYVSFNEKYMNEAFAHFNFKKDLVYIGTSWVNNKKDNTYFEDWFNFLKKKYNFQLDYLKTEGCAVNFYYGKNDFFIGEKNILLAGEATGLIYNYGIGITPALINGKDCATAILNQKEVFETYYELAQAELKNARKTYEIQLRQGSVK